MVSPLLPQTSLSLQDLTISFSVIKIIKETIGIANVSQLDEKGINIIGGCFSDVSGLLSTILHRVFYQTPGIHMVMYCFTLAL